VLLRPADGGSPIETVLWVTEHVPTSKGNTRVLVVLTV